ncbi:hypothetical protein MPL3365_130514 [Mesorhizobium plurifarium]|uniref:Uncharacterized protein n=1 Tax=Mesorhizobium plurifarium TaxID=69974 RepID=A0A090FWV4_MESPL|nr:hypothetical protein MPL3365_130514 [Mesorhizobium plurifarium]
MIFAMTVMRQSAAQILSGWRESNLYAAEIRHRSGVAHSRRIGGEDSGASNRALAESYLSSRWVSFCSWHVRHKSFC